MSLPNNISFIEALSILSKSSPYAVSTEKSDHSDVFLDQIKEYLYIEMPIEEWVNSIISSLGSNNKKIVFLCGSSGDGKSEILTRCKKKFDSRVKFHLDATHSFAPHENAIQTLNREIASYQLDNSPLVVGINTGMLGNYAEEGADETIKEGIRAYLNREEYSDELIFINFEDYPKFQIGEHGYHADFPEKLLSRITRKENNLLRQLFYKDKELFNDVDSKRLFANYELLTLPSVQEVIINLLFKARLMRDQFLTARALLDFIFGLLAGPGYLFDNLFSGGDNELSEKIVEFDPANLRTKSIDRFILAFELKLTEPEFKIFKDELTTIGIKRVSKSHSFLRLFYILRGGEYGNNYHHKFKQDFSESLIEQYVQFYKLHRDYNGDKADKKKVKTFYNQTIIKAAHKYINRNAPNLSTDEFLISELNDYKLSSKLDIEPDYSAIQNFKPTSASFFNVYLEINGQKIRPISMNINLLSLLKNIVEGYRPNKHDKSTVVLLDELVDDLSMIANKSKELNIVKNKKSFELKIDSDGEIGVKEVDHA